MRIIGVLSAERPCQQRSPWHIAGPSFGEHPGQSEQYRACFKRNRLAGMADNMAAGIDDEGLRRQESFHIVESQKLLPAPRDQPRRGLIQDASRGFNFS